jgi:hypothetical protein
LAEKHLRLLLEGVEMSGSQPVEEKIPPETKEKAGLKPESKT